MPTTDVAPGSYEQLQEIADLMGRSKKVVVITGAGISTNAGIPDFRSENGLYALIQAHYDAMSITTTETAVDSQRPAKRRRIERSLSADCSSLSSETFQSARRLQASQSLNGNDADKSVPLYGAGMKARSAGHDLPCASLVAESLQSRGGRSSTASERVSATGEDHDSSRAHTLVSMHSSSGERHFSIDETSRRIHITNNETTSTVAPTPSQNDSLPTINRYNLPNLKGKDLFDSIIWKDPHTTSIFYTFISSLRKKIVDEVRGTTRTHKLLRALRDGGRLVRNYTQNIDMLEGREGLCTDLQKGVGNRSRFRPKTTRNLGIEDLRGDTRQGGVEVVCLHGSLDLLRCALCGRSSSWDDDDRHNLTLNGEAPECPWCASANAKREDRGRRSLAIGRLRPDIVLYGEEHPAAHLVAPLITHDLSLRPDVLLILGTSLRVHGLKVMVKEFAKAVHGKKGKVVYVNQSRPPESVWGDVIDFWVSWDCDAWVEDLKQRRQDIWEPQQEAGERSEKPRLAAKNPSSIRPDNSSGAYHTRRILSQLRRISGRVEQAQSLVEDYQQLCDAQLSSHCLSLGTDSSSGHAAKHESSGKRKLACHRPGSVRPHRENGASLVPDILASLRRLCRGESRTSGSHERSALKPISSNAPARRKYTKKTAQVRDGLPSLPTPPASDPECGTPLTPKTQRIKRLGSISAILSSPTHFHVKVWQD